jgi:ribosomal-protein-alanine N-acetyltransferase
MNPPLTITPLEKRHRQAVDDLIFRHYQVHTHLDWQAVDDWLETTVSPVRLAWQGARLVGVLGVSQPLNRTAWFRLAALHDLAPADTVFALLWESVTAELCRLSTQTVAVLAARTWVEEAVQRLGFRFAEDIITLRRDGDLLPAPRPSPLTVRLGTVADFEAMLAVDQAAFDPPWQLSADEIRHAAHIAAIYTVALAGQQIVGYQVSTRYHEGAHLARLAVDPAHQGQGVGGLLLHDVLFRFFRRRVYSMTVNTQAGNLRSQRLYTRFGFQRNGYDLPVWSIRL